MATFDPRDELRCRRFSFVPLTYFVFMTSSLICHMIGLSSAQNTQDSIDLVFYTNSTDTNQTEECPPCPKPDDNDTSVGVILGSVIGGAIVGGALTAVLMTYLRNRSQSPPPKDYDGREDQAHFDVNRNDDVTLTNGGDKDVEEGTDPLTSKSHKKLERLVQRNPYQKPVDFNTEMAAVPLIHNADSPSDEAAPQRTTPENTNTAATGAASNNPKTPAKKAENDEESGYLNIGDRGLLEQPYDALAVVPEEVEYENDKQHVYEPILQENDASRA